MVEIQLTQNKIALIDDEDYDIVSLFKWHVHAGRNNCCYAITNIYIGNNKHSMMRMHRLIMNASKEQKVDHRDWDDLNNQKHNLRFCTESENQMNRQLRLNTKSRFKGVYYHKQNRNWVASLKINYKKKNLGSFTSEVDAAKAYNKAAVEYFGDFAVLNEVN